MIPFNVINENNGKFEPYDIMPYLINTWYDFCEKVESFQDDPGNYWKIPTTFEGYKTWVIRELKYMYWSRCQYEIQLLPWPHNEKDIPKKVDIYWQCEMNIDTIVNIFISNIEE